MNRFPRVEPLDVDLSALQRPLEGLVDAGLGQDLREREHQIASRRPEQTAGFDPGEVGIGEPAPVPGPLDGAEEVLVARVRLDDDRRPLGGGVVHENVHPVSQVRVPGTGEERREVRGFRPPHELLEVLERVMAHLLQEPLGRSPG